MAVSPGRRHRIRVFQQYPRYVAKLLQVKKVGKQTNVIEVACQREGLNHGDAFILDAGTTIYVWKGGRACSNASSWAAAMAELATYGSRRPRAGAGQALWAPEQSVGGLGPRSAAVEPPRGAALNPSFAACGHLRWRTLLPS